MAKKILLALALIVLLLSVVGCNTVQGLGEDITAIGEAGEELLTGK